MDPTPPKINDLGNDMDTVKDTSGGGSPSKNPGGWEPRQKRPKVDVSDGSPAVCGEDSSAVTGGASADTPICQVTDRNGTVLMVKFLPWGLTYDNIAQQYNQYGMVEEVRLRAVVSKKAWEAYITYASPKEAMSAFIKTNDSDNSGISYDIVSKAPGDLDPYYPSEWNKIPVPTERLPRPPRYIIATSVSERCNIIKMKRYLQQQAGGISKENIQRFGKNSVLITCKSSTQSILLSHMVVQKNSVLKHLKIHYSFSYGKGVSFNDNIYEFDEEEILEMSPNCVWKVFKVLKSKMVIFTFKDSHIPPELNFEGLKVTIRPFKPRPLQCFNCFAFGHPSKVCKRVKVCGTCSQPSHGECDNPAVCYNCKGNHSPRDKKCPTYIMEEQAVLLSQANHISLGHAKSIVVKKKYSEAVTQGKPNPQQSKKPQSSKPKQPEKKPAIPIKRSKSLSNLGKKKSDGQAAGPAPAVPRCHSSGHISSLCNKKGANHPTALPRRELSPSELQVHPAPLAPRLGGPSASSVEAPLASPVEVPQASPVEVPQASPVEAPQAFPVEASQASLSGASTVPLDGTSQVSPETFPASPLPDLGRTPPRGQQDKSNEEMETTSTGSKRSRAPSSPPPLPQKPGVPTANRFQALASGAEGLKDPKPLGPSGPSVKLKKVVGKKLPKLNLPRPSSGKRTATKKSSS